MATASLAATPRTATGKGAARSLRRDGQIPAVIYGHARQSQSLAINTRELERLLSRVSAETTVIELSLDGRTTRTLIREIQRHPFKRSIIHVDFQELVAGEKVTVDVPIVIVGTAAGVREGGILDQVMRELSVEVDPANIPNHIDVDVTSLTIGHSVHVSDLVLPEGVTVLDDPDATVAVVSAPKVVEEAPAAPTEAEAVAEPEVIGKKKEDEEAEEQ
jgi:large subunit ribosomal protein L25